MSIRKDPTDMIAITSIWTEDELITKGTILPSNHPAVKRNRTFFVEATLGSTLDPKAMHAAERQLWARSVFIQHHPARPEALARLLRQL
jgi:hypothetical protein